MNLKRILNPLWTRINMMLCKGEGRTVNDTTPMQLQKVQLLEGETLEGVEHPQNYGFTSNPPQGADILAGSLGGNRDHVVVIVSDHADFRKTGLATGEVAVYHKSGSYILMKDDGSIELNPSSGTVSVVGDLQSSGEISDGTGTLSAVRQKSDNHIDVVYPAHVHTSAAPGQPTSPPLV